MKTLVIIFSLVLLIACDKKPKEKEIVQIPIVMAEVPDLIISEVSSHAYLENEFGKAADWLEIHNNSDVEVVLEKNDWTLTDNLEKPNKFEIPEVKIAAHDYLIIWCDKNQFGGSDIHANFKISSKDEDVALYYKGNMVDQVHIDSNNSQFKSVVRSTENLDLWEVTEDPTPGTGDS
jgi:hypothetical protein